MIGCRAETVETSKRDHLFLLLFLSLNYVAAAVAAVAAVAAKDLALLCRRAPHDFPVHCVEFQLLSGRRSDSLILLLLLFSFSFNKLFVVNILLSIHIIYQKSKSEIFKSSCNSQRPQQMQKKTTQKKMKRFSTGGKIHI